MREVELDSVEQELNVRDKVALLSSKDGDGADPAQMEDGSPKFVAAAYPDSHRHITVRAVVVGILVGGLMCFSNMYFGLQTGWVTMGSLQSTILGFLVFRLFNFKLKTKFTALENVVLQTAAVATATMPLAGGFVGIIPALEEIGIHLSWWELTLWSISVAFFGVFFAVPLRTQVLLKEKLKFPSGTATAQMIATLHRLDLHEEPNTGGGGLEASGSQFSLLRNSDESEPPESAEESAEWNKKWKILLGTFAISSLYMLLSYFFPGLATLNIFSWVGLSVVTSYSWYITPSLSYVGQGLIMGPKTCATMMAGTIVGWGILAPIAHNNGWAPGKIDSWQDGAKGWIMWVSLAIMMGESISSLIVIGVKAVYSYKKSSSVDVDDPTPEEHKVPVLWWSVGLGLSTILCVAVVAPLFHMPFYQPLIAVILACITSVLAVRALGETDLNPVSGIGKVSQIVFAGIAPGSVIANLLAGAISEAGAQQAGDLMQDLKTGQIMKASPRAQFYSQIIGSFFSAFLAVAAYELYSNAYSIPSAQLPAPTAAIWLDMAKLMNGGSLAHNVMGFCVGFCIIAAILPILEAVLHHRGKNTEFLPSAVAFAIGMYVTPNWTIARVIGGLAQYIWEKKWPSSNRKYMILVASGFVLGEGVMSIVTALLKVAGVHSYSS